MTFIQFFSQKRKKAMPMHRFLHAGLLVQLESLFESVHSAACIDQLLLAGVEGVALGTNFDLDILLGGSSLNHIAACTANGGLLIVGVDSFLHRVHLPLLLKNL